MKTSKSRRDQSSIEEQYLNTMSRILSDGEWRETRNGKRLTVFGATLTHDLQQGFPLLTTKKVWMRGVVEELYWMLSGSTNIHSLQAKGVHIWDLWADDDGEVGKLYGYQWRHWAGKIDQLANVISSLRENPMSSRHIVTAWNPSDLDQGNLPPCHILFQFDVTASGKLNLSVYQRSADWFLGVPFNIASYALLNHIIANLTRYTPGCMMYTFTNVHLYYNQIEAAEKQLGRRPLSLPRVEVMAAQGRNEDIDFRYNMTDYEHHPPIVVRVIA